MTIRYAIIPAFLLSFLRYMREEITHRSAPYSQPHPIYTDRVGLIHSRRWRCVLLLPPVFFRTTQLLLASTCVSHTCKVNHKTTARSVEVLVFPRSCPPRYYLNPPSRFGGDRCFARNVATQGSRQKSRVPMWLAWAWCA